MVGVDQGLQHPGHASREVDVWIVHPETMLLLTEGLAIQVEDQLGLANQQVALPHPAQVDVEVELHQHASFLSYDRPCACDYGYDAHQSSLFFVDGYDCDFCSCLCPGSGPSMDLLLFRPLYFPFGQAN